MKGRRAVFLDRDGVLIDSIVRDGKPYAATTPEEVRIIAGVREACAELAHLDYLLIMTTNQPDIARGKISRAFVEETNEFLRRELNLDDVEMCAHDEADDCICRKPKPGLMLQAAQKHNIDLAASIVVGDRWRDVEAGRNAGCSTVFVDLGYTEAVTAPPDHVTNSLRNAVAWMRLKTEKKKD